MVCLDARHHLIVHGLPPLDLLLEIPVPIHLRHLHIALVPLRIPNLFHGTRPVLTSTLWHDIKRFRQCEMYDTHLILDRVPIFPTLCFDREVAVVHVGESNGLLAVVEVKEPLFRVVVFVLFSGNLCDHVIENAGIGFDGQHAGVEPDAEPSVVQIHVRAGGEHERDIEQLVKVSFHEGVCVEIDDRLERSRGSIQSPNPQLRILIQEPPKDALAAIRRGYVFRGEELPAGGFDPTEGVVGDFFGEVDYDFACRAGGLGYGVAEGGDGDAVRVRVERCHDRSLVGVCGGGAGSSWRNQISKRNKKETNKQKLGG